MVCLWTRLAKRFQSDCIDRQTGISQEIPGMRCPDRCSYAALIDAATLPYDPHVITYIKNYRARGGRTALVTASDQQIALMIAEYLELFDEVYGSDGVRNLKGPVKADFLAKHFEGTEFAYMGDATADLPVWKRADKIITVNASKTLKRHTEQLGIETEHFSTLHVSLLSYLKALRPHQWLKNTLVFLPILVAHQLSTITFLYCLFTFIAFCLIASSVYVLNDLLDLKTDRAHPRKCLRPLASGNIPIAHGTWMVAGLLLAGLAVAIPLGWNFVLVMLTYYISAAAYSLHLKRLIIIDICMLAGLYTMRIMAGGVATDIQLSVWLLAFSIFFFFALAAIKRQAELVDNAQHGKLNASGRGYHVDDLPLVSVIGIGSGYMSVLVMALYINSPAVLELYTSPAVLWGICFVLFYWISHMAITTHRGGMHDDPLVYAIQDRISQVCFFLILLFSVGGQFCDAQNTGHTVRLFCHSRYACQPDNTTFGFAGWEYQ